MAEGVAIDTWPGGNSDRFVLQLTDYGLGSFVLSEAQSDGNRKHHRPWSAVAGSSPRGASLVDRRSQCSRTVKCTDRMRCGPDSSLVHRKWITVFAEYVDALIHRG